MVDNNKVSQKEIDKAMNSFMKNAAAGPLPSGMAVPMMSLMGMNGMMGSNPATMPAINPLASQMTSSSIVNPYQQNPYQQGYAQMPNAQNYKAVGMGVRVRLGKAKNRDFGHCKECAKMSVESRLSDDGQAMETYQYCNAKQKRVNPEGGIKTIEVEIAGKKEQQIDTCHSCRIFERME